MRDDAELLAAQRAERERRYDAEIAEWHQQNPGENAAHLTAAAIAACGLCDADGYRPNGGVCDHVDRSATARAGIAKVRAAIAHKQLTIDDGNTQ